ncbi:MAG: hypothetical protein C5B60_04660, partial [Chloroflexi bacterium]
MRPVFSTTRAGGRLPQLIAAWVHTLTPRRIGGLLLLLAALVTLSTYLLQAQLTYPVILLDTPSLAQAFVARGAALILLGLIGLLLSGGLLVVISLALSHPLAPPVRQRILVTGAAAGILWSIGALIGLLLVPLWGHAPAGVTTILTTPVLLMGEIAA